MNIKKRNILKKIIYVILFVLMIFAFIYLSEKYKDNSKEEVKTISNYYPEINSDVFNVINGTKLINVIKKDKSIIFIGSQTSRWSRQYIKELNSIFQEIGLDKIYYYDINNDKAQKNSNYYEIRELLNGFLTSTDGSENNLLAPSFYIIDNGKVLYYNNDTVAMKNTTEIEDYWTEEQKKQFAFEIKNAINKYYLNKN